MRPSLWICAFLLIPVHAFGYTPAQEKYAKGVLAHNEGDCWTAIALLEQAAAEEPDEGLSKFKYKGLNKEDYFPHFYLGRCLEKEGRTLEALSAFRESERQGVIRGRSALSAILNAALRRLEERSAPKPAQAPAVATALPTASPVPPTAAVPLPAAAPVPQRQEERPVAQPLPATGEIPESLRQALKDGIKLFFRADYAGAISSLEPLAARHSVARIFLAYSQAGIYLCGKGNEEMLQAAKRNYRAVAAARIPQAEREWISPAILRLLSSGFSERAKESRK